MSGFFNFFPVGQGLFYYGRIISDDYSFAYDCGTTTSTVNIVSFCNTLKKLNKEKPLDFLAISHFHQDHINGIVQLSNIVGFKKVFLPYICGSSIVRKAIIAVLYSNQQEKLDGRSIENLFYIFRLYESNDNAVFNNNNYSFKTGNWIFKFFNRAITKKEEKNLLGALNSLLLHSGCMTIEDYIIKNGVVGLQTVYSKVFGGSKLNRTSLVLLHYPKIANYNSILHYPSAPYYYYLYSLNCNSTTHPFTLLTGDLDFNKSIAKEIIKEYPTGVAGIVQVPHHGSGRNWMTFYKYLNSFDCYVVPFGTRNPYRHPSPIIKSSVGASKYYPVTEYCGFFYWI